MNIEKLLNSTVLEDVLIGVELAYKHWDDNKFRGFFSVFYNNLKNYEPLYYEFYRNNVRYVLGNAQILESSSMWELHDWTDITPK